MALTQTLAQMRGNLRKFANIEGTTAELRHPNADCNDYLNQGLGSLHRYLTEALPDQRFLASTTITMVSGDTVYDLPADFDHLISVDLVANGAKAWLVAYEMHERPALTDANQSFSGVPYCYRLRGGNIEYLPGPTSAYVSTLWYVPTATQLVSDGTSFDTISRLDTYVFAFAAQFIATKDKNWDLNSAAKTLCAELKEEIYALARSRDKNSPSRIVDESFTNRFGRRVVSRRYR